MPKRLFLIDGASLAYRSYFAFFKNPLTNSKGENTSAIFGFTSTIIRLLEKENPDYLAVIFDSSQPTFRHRKYSEYKATRDKMPPDLARQIPYIEKVVKAFNIPFITLPGFEADDIIGTLVVKAQQQNIESFMVTGDKDFMQLITPLVKMYVFKKGEEIIIDAEGVVQKFGIKPSQIRDFLGLMGDTSDNIPGIPGIGEKTAISLIQQFGSLESIFKDLETIDKEKIRESIKKYKELAILSRELATIDTNVPIEVDFDELKVKSPNKSELLELFRLFEFNSLIKKLSLETTGAGKYVIISDENSFKNIITELQNASSFVFDLETTNLSPREAEIVGISFSLREGEAFYLPMFPEKCIIESIPISDHIGYFLNKLKPIFLDETIKKGGQNIKYDILVLQNYGIEVKGIDFDTMIESYLIDPTLRQHNLDYLSLKYLNIQKIPISDLIGTGKSQISMKEVPVEKVGRYSCEDADVTFRLHNLFIPKLERMSLMDLYRNVEIPLITVLAKMEANGVSIDPSVLQEFSKTLNIKMEDLSYRIYKLAGEEFNINSPKQLAHILYDKLELHKKIGRKQPKKTQTGYSTDIEALEKLAEYPDAHIVREILEYRSIAKLKNTYADTLPSLINPKTGRIHTSFNQTVTATGRLSSSDPNLQNIPIRTEIGRTIRKAFIPRDPSSSLLMSADYSQIELRILAHLCDDEELIKAFEEEKDIHRNTASKIFGVPEKDVTPEMRSRAKAINFGVLYGMGPQRLSRESGISLEEAQNFIENYFEKYPSIKAYIDRQIKFVETNGYVTTILGRRRFIPDIHSKNPKIRVNAEHIAINTPIQGSAADMIKVAMIRIDRRMNELKMKSQMILQVHDELVFEVPLEEVEELKKIVKNEMQNAIFLKVPIRVDIGTGKNWLEAH